MSYKPNHPWYNHSLSGSVCDFLRPTVDMINIHDIATALSNSCRFNGQINRFYSVAEHSVRVAWLVSDERKFQALMHDAAEAYLGDVARPLKGMMSGYDELEARFEKVIAEKFGVEQFPSSEIKKADTTLVYAESKKFRGEHSTDDWQDFGNYDPTFALGGSAGWQSSFARRSFIDAFEEYSC
jgi:uncharacterized protein